MRIGQLAEAMGLDTQTIRFYERQGLLEPPCRQNNGYRIYTEGFYPNSTDGFERAENF